MRTKTLPDAIKSRTQCGNTTVINYQPGNGSLYIIHLTDLRAMEGGVYTVALMTTGHGTCMTVADTGGYLSPGYVAEKLKVGRGDAGVLAEVIAHLTGRKADDASVPNRVGQ
jgi:hypothetical protein